MRCFILAGIALAAAGSLSPTGAGAAVSFHTLEHWVPTVTPPDQPNPTVLAASTSLVADPTGRILYAISRDGSNGWIGAYNADSLGPMGAGLATAQMTAATPDIAGGRLFAASQSASGVPSLEVFTAGAGGVSHPNSAPLSALAGVSVIGIYQSSSADLYLLAANYPPNVLTFVPGSVQVAKVDLRTLTNSAVTVSWTATVPSCQMPVAYTQQPGMWNLIHPGGIGYVPSQHALYFGCTAEQVPGFPQRAPVPTGVGQLIVPTDGSAPTSANFNLFSHPGNFSYGDAFFDRQSQRLVLGASGTAAVFDCATNSYVGNINLGLQPSLLGAGMNSRTGQFYGFSSNVHDGLIAAFIRLTPVGQAFFDTDYAPKLTPPQSPVAVDAGANRLFLAETNSTSDGSVYFLVIQYDGDTALPPPPPDPDQNTTNVPEQAGQTARIFSGSAQGYGAVTRWVGGTDAATKNTTTLDTEGVGPVGAGTRELRLAYLNQVSLSLSQASASVIPVDRDGSNTGHDQAALCSAPYTQVSPPSPLPAPPSQLPAPPAPPQQWNTTVCSWPSTVAQCSNYGGAPQQDAEPSQGGNATAGCDVDHQAVSAAASVSGFPINGVEVASATVNSSVSVNASQGTVTTVTSVAKGVNVMSGALQIGEVSATATSTAHGHDNTAKSAFVRTLKNVVVQGTEYCSTQCDANSLAAQLNAQFAGLMRIDFPSPDPSLQASPGGYQALIRRPLSEQIQDGDLNDQPADRTEVPAMVVTLFVGDNTKPARMITYLAGAETEARYGVYPLGQPIDQPIPGTPFIGGSSGGVAIPSITGLVGGDGSAPIPAGTGGAGSTQAGGKGNSPLAALLPPGGWKWIAEHPLQAIKLLFMWMVLLSPIYVAARRWLLLQRNRVLQEAMG